MNINAVARFRSALLCVLCVISIQTQAASIELTPQMRAQLRAAVEDMQTRMNIKGVSAAVITQSEAFPIVAGVSYAGRPITSDMAFGIGSVTKTLTSTTLVLMQEKGLVNLDDSIGRWIPSHPFIDPAITVRQLLQHRSGLADFSLTQEYRSAVLANAGRVFTPEDLLAYIQKPLAQRNTTFNYCNTNYLLAGMIISKITGEKVGATYRRLIFDRLSMDSTFMGVEDTVPVEVAVRWLGTQSGQNVSINAAFSGAWTAGAVFSTAREIATFMRELHRGNVVSPTSLAEMHSYPDTNVYGLGVRRQILAGNVVLGHTGSIRGYESIVLYVPSIDVGISVLVNQGPSEPFMIAARMIEILTQETSVAEISHQQVLQVTPNPAASHITISGLPSEHSIAIFDAAGRILHHEHGLYAQRMDVSMLAPGMYTLVVSGPRLRYAMPLAIVR
jgi:D-alanyl-D-alanine carboxypeptidase